MKLRRILAAAVLAASSALSLYAAGHAETQWVEADGLRNWSHAFDVAGKKPGTYNVVAEVRDAAGNLRVAGPLNIKVDPKTDLPLASIANPLPLMKVTGDLSLVGTCDDDDGVSKVEYRLDDGPWEAAQGGAFWSRYFKADEIPEGRRRVSVRGVDVNGLVGPERSVLFDMDKRRPEAVPASPASGALVSGKVVLKGTASDSNGVVSVSYSLDGGKTFAAAPGKADKKAGARTFEAAFDTRKLKDGPLAVWLRAVDGVGTVGVSPALLVVDNTKPTLELVSPAPAEAVDADFVVFGRARDDVGLASLSWAVGKQGGPVALTRGDDFWTVPISLKDHSGKEITLVLTAVDSSGNKTELRQKLKLDLEADKPRTTLLSPAPASKAEGSVFLSAWARDDDGIAAFEYKVDQGAYAKVPSTGTLAVEVSGLAPGKRTIKVRAVDAKGHAGPDTQVQVEAQGAAPKVRFAGLVSGSGPAAKNADLVPGMRVEADGRSSLRLAVEGGAPIETLRWKFFGLRAGSASAEPGSASPQTRKVNAKAPAELAIPLGRDLPFGSFGVEAEVVDAYGRSAKASTHLSTLDLSAVRGDPAFSFSDARLGADRSLRFAPGPDGKVRPLSGRFVGAELASVSLVPDDGSFKIERDGAFVSIAPASDADLGATRVLLLAVDAKGHRYRSEPYSFSADFRAPVLGLDGNGGLCGRSLVVAGRAEDAGPLKLSLEIPSAGLKSEAAVSDGRFRTTLDVSSLPDGPLSVSVRAADVAGNESVAWLEVRKDTEAPAVDFVLPASAQDAAAAAFFVSDPSGVAVVEYAADGASFAPVDGSGAYLIGAPGGFPAAAKLRVKDGAGNERVVDIPYAGSPVAAPGELPPADPKADPSLSVLYPKAGAPVSGPSFLVFRANAPRPLASVSWSFAKKTGELAPTALLALPEAGAYLGVVKVDDAVAGNAAAKPSGASAKVSVKDSAGKSAAAAVDFSADPARAYPTALPELAVAEAAKLSVLGPDALLRTQGTAPGGLKALRFTLDSAAPVEVPASAGASYKASGLSPGVHTLSVVALDAAGRESVPAKRSFRVAGPAPLADFTAFAAKAGRADFKAGLSVAVDASTRLEGKVLAPNGLASLDLRFGDGPAVKASYKKEGAGVYSFSVPVPENLPFDRFELRAAAADEGGLKSETLSFAYRVAAVPAAGVFNAEGLSAADSRLGADGVLRFWDAEPLVLRFNGRPLASARLEPAVPFVAVSFDGDKVVLTPSADGVADGVSVSAKTEEGDEFSWGPLRLVSDRAAPVLELESPASDAWFKDSAPLSLSASGGVGALSLSYSLDGGEARNLDASLLRGGKASAPLALSGADGPRSLTVTVKDEAGRGASLVRVFNRDAAPPIGAVAVPRPADPVNGRSSVAARFSDPGGALGSLECSVDGGKTWEPSAQAAWQSRQVDFAALPPGGKVLFRSTDLAGNAATAENLFAPDAEADKPRVLVVVPAEGETIRSDFVLSGAAFDDDAVAALSWRIDAGPWTRIEVKGNGFAIPLKLTDFTDNEHVLSLFAEDIYGVKGDEVSRNIKVSLAEPKATAAYPAMDKTVRGIVELSGSAADANGIGRVDLSFDNAVSFEKASGAEAWTYRLDTRSLSDGMHSLYVRPEDKYGVQGFFATLISVDNTPPELALDLPSDGVAADKALVVSGRVSDTRRLASVEAVVFPRGSAAGAKTERRVDLGTDLVISRSLDLSGLPDGEYGLRISAKDEAGNETLASRDFRVQAGYRDEGISILSPANGEKLSGRLFVSGRLRSASKVSSVVLLLDGADAGTAVPDSNGYFGADLGAAAAGGRTVQARFLDAEGAGVLSEKVEVDFAPGGPWVRPENFPVGAYLPYRPFLSGGAGWEPAPGEEAPADKKAAAARKADRTPILVELSVDNGRSFRKASGTAKWKVRMETQDWAEGRLPLILRGTFKDGSTAVRKLMLNLDKTPPAAELRTPSEGRGFNDKVVVSGTASDAGGLASVRMALRDGDKSGYKMPSFIQGLYLDSHVFGEPAYEFGVGVSFFEDNVKLQAAYGNTPQTFLGKDRGRFHGSVYSGKLLANIFSFPFGFVLGPDWDFLSANVAVGANFSYFSQTQQADTVAGSGGTGMTLGALVAQLEFPKITFRDRTFLRSCSFYVEAQAWFVSAELDGGLKPAVALGLRTSLL